MIKHLSIGIFLSVTLAATAYGYEGEPLDLDLDGIPDQITVSVPDKFSENLNHDAPVNVQINFSSKIKSYEKNFTLSEVYIPNLHVTSWYKNPGYLLFSYTNYSTRDATELNYKIYKWNSQRDELCLYVAVTGMKANQLENERFPSEKHVSIFNDCIGLGGSKLDAEYYSNQEDNDIIMKIAVEKAELYNAPKLSLKTKMYLIKDDSVLIRKHEYSGGVDWFLVEFSSKKETKSIVKWLPGKSIGLILAD